MDYAHGIHILNTFLFYPPFPSLPPLIVRLFFSWVLHFYSLCHYWWPWVLTPSLFAPCPMRETVTSKTFSFLEVLFRSGYDPDCFQPFRIINVFSVWEPSQRIFGNFVFYHCPLGHPGDSWMDIKIFHFHQDLSDITAIFDQSSVSSGFFRFMGGTVALPSLFCKNVPELVYFLSRITYVRW